MIQVGFGLPSSAAYNDPLVPGKLTRPQLIAVESALLLAGLVVILIVVGFPFTGDGGGSGEEVAAANAPQVDPGPDVAGEADEGPQEASPPASAGRCCSGPADRDFFTGNQILSYYGNPYTSHMGILGQHDPREVVRLLEEQSRTLDAANGFRLNGQMLKLKGGCMHHDNGPLGAATIDRAEERRGVDRVGAPPRERAPAKPGVDLAEGSAPARLALEGGRSIARLLEDRAAHAGERRGRVAP